MWQIMSCMSSSIRADVLGALFERGRFIESIPLSASCLAVEDTCTNLIMQCSCVAFAAGTGTRSCLSVSITIKIKLNGIKEHVRIGMR